MPGLFNVKTDTKHVIEVRDKLDTLIKAIYKANQQDKFYFLLKRAELLRNHNSLLAFYTYNLKNDYSESQSESQSESLIDKLTFNNLVSNINSLNIGQYTGLRLNESYKHADIVLKSAKRWSDTFYFTGVLMLAVGLLAIIAIAIAMAISNSAALPVVGFALKCSLIYGGLGFTALGLLTTAGAHVETYVVTKGTRYFNERLKQNYGTLTDDTSPSAACSPVSSSQADISSDAKEDYASIVEEFAKIDAEKKNSSPNYSKG